MGRVYWITGLSGAGKTTVGTSLYDHLRRQKDNVVFLDGDILREVFQNTDYSYEARKTLGFQYARLCKLLSDQGMDIVICAIVMFDEIREWNRENFSDYMEIYLEVPMEELQRRNQKKLYSQAAAGEVRNVVGMDLELELPKNPDLTIRNYGDTSVKEALKRILEHLS